jgi:hypothetical protein
MPFALRDVGLNCFALVFAGEDVGSVFSAEDDDARPWVAVLAERRLGRNMPPPFTAPSHRCASLTHVQAWLGIAEPAAAA